jgi:hypothetical protein
MAKDEIARGGGLQSEAPGPYSGGPYRTDLAVPAYILAVAAVEAFVNEIFLSGFGQMALGPSPAEAGHAGLSDMAKSLEKLDLPTKLIEVPRMVVGRSLDRGNQPHQDMTLLTRLRNELVHYKMGDEPPEAVSVLARREVAFPVPPEQEAGGPYPWADRVSTLEGIRWAYNTACATAVALLDLIPEKQRGQLDSLRHNFREIP